MGYRSYSFSYSCASKLRLCELEEDAMEASGPELEPAKAWRQLGHRQRMDVLHHARQGRPYPDPKVATIALRWAQWWQAQPLPYKARAALRYSIKLDALLAVALVGGVLTGGQLMVGRSGNLIGSVALWFLVTV